MGLQKMLRQELFTIVMIYFLIFQVPIMAGVRNEMIASRGQTVNPNIVFQPETSDLVNRSISFNYRSDLMPGTKNDSSFTRGQSGMPSVAFQQDDVESAGKLVDFFIQQDNAFPRLSTQLSLSDQSES